MDDDSDSQNSHNKYRILSDVLKIFSDTFQDKRFTFALYIETFLLLLVGFFSWKLGPQAWMFDRALVALILVPLIVPWLVPRGDKGCGITESNQDGADQIIKLVDRKKKEIWAGFEGVYNAYNAPWELEFRGNTNDYVAIHKKRFANKKLERANYLYFFNEENWDSFFKRFEKFVRFEAMVFLNLSTREARPENITEHLEKKMDLTPANIDSLNLYLVPGPEPQLTFFQGTKADERASVLYFNFAEFMEDGLPSSVLYSHGDGISKPLESYFGKEAKEEILHTGMDIFHLYLKIKQEGIAALKN